MTTRRHLCARGHPRKLRACRQISWLPGCPGVIAPLRHTLIAAVLLLASLPTLRAQTPEIVFDLKIEEGRLAANMRLIRVRQGDAVKLRWTTDRAIALHLHGYDIAVKVEPGAVAEMAFKARAAGRFPVEEHKPNTEGGHSHGEAPLVRVEVSPR